MHPFSGNRPGSGWWKRASSAWSRNGPAGFLALIGKNIVHQLGRLWPWRTARRIDLPSLQFDSTLGVETEGVREIGSLEIDSKNTRHAVRYEPTPIALARDFISVLPIRHESFSFVDYGAGKGRVLLAAAHWPFEAVIGVEFSGELQAIAARNIERLGHAQRAGSLRCEHGDAVDFEPPSTPLVCYLYNPFGAHVLGRVLESLERSLRAAPREAYAIYVEPQHHSLFRPEAGWEVALRRPRGVVYRYSPKTAAARGGNPRDGRHS